METLPAPPLGRELREISFSDTLLIIKSPFKGDLEGRIKSLLLSEWKL